MITELVDGVLALIKDGLPYLKKCEDLPDKKVLDDLMDQMLNSTPAVYVLYDGTTFAKPKHTAFRQVVEPGVILAVMTKSLRDSTGRAALRGDGNKEGAYVILEDLRAALLGKVVADGFGIMHQAAEGLYAVKNGGVVYLATYRSSSYLLKA